MNKEDMAPKSPITTVNQNETEDEDLLVSDGPKDLKDLLHSPLILATSKSTIDQLNFPDSTPKRSSDQLAKMVSIQKQESRDDDEDQLLLIDGSSCKKNSKSLLQLSPCDIAKQVETDEWAKYRIIDILGEGSYGKVYKVQRLSINRRSEAIINQDLEPQSLTANSNILSQETNAPFARAIGVTNHVKQIHHYHNHRKTQASRNLMVVKELQTDQMPKREALKAMNEIDLHGQLANAPFVVKYIDSFISGQNKVNIVMEYCQGGDLQGMLRTRRQNDRPLAEMTALKYFLQMCIGLEAIHKKKILHRDLKAQNVFLTSKQDEVRIGDFGLAKQMVKQILLASSKSQRVLVQPGDKSTPRHLGVDLTLMEGQLQRQKFEIENTSKVGTPFYLAPELISSSLTDSESQSSDKRHPYTTKSDMWALGVILYEMCALRKPFVGQNEDELYKKVKEAKPTVIRSTTRPLMQIILALLSKDPSKRPSIREIFDMEFIRSKALILKIDLPPKRQLRQTKTIAHFQDGFKKLVLKQKSQVGVRQVLQSDFCFNSKVAQAHNKSRGSVIGSLKKHVVVNNNELQYASHSTLIDAPAIIMNRDLENARSDNQSSVRRNPTVKTLPYLQPQQFPHQSQSTLTKVPCKKQVVPPLKVKALKKYPKQIIDSQGIQNEQYQAPAPLRRLKTARSVRNNITLQAHDLMVDSVGKKFVQRVTSTAFGSFLFNPKQQPKSGRVHKAPLMKNIIVSKVLGSPSLSQQQQLQLKQFKDKRRQSANLQSVVLREKRPSNIIQRQSISHVQSPTSKTALTGIQRQQLIAQATSRNLTNSSSKALTTIPIENEKLGIIHCSSFEPIDHQVTQANQPSILATAYTTLTSKTVMGPMNQRKKSIRLKKKENAMQSITNAYSSQSHFNTNKGSLTKKFNQLLEQAHRSTKILNSGAQTERQKVAESMRSSLNKIMHDKPNRV